MTWIKVEFEIGTIHTHPFLSQKSQNMIDTEVRGCPPEPCMGRHLSSPDYITTFSH